MISKDELEKLYLIDKISIKDFKEKYNIPVATLYRYLKKYNISKNRSLDIPKETLYDLYITQNLTLNQIGDMYGFDHHSVSALCKKYGIVKEYINKDEFKELLEKHQSYTKVTQILKEKYHKPFSIDSISKYAKKYGYNIYVKSEYEKYNNPDTIEKIKKLAENDLMTIREISKKLSISRKIIAKLIKENDIQALHLKGLNCYTRNISEENIQILHTKELLEQYIKENNIVSPNDLGNKLNIAGSTAYIYCLKYNIMKMFPKQSSQPEHEILNYINQYYETENNTRKYLDGKEIDIYIPKLKLGIEFNGNYWHSDNFTSHKYHQDKSLLAEREGIFIYHIFEYEWDLKREQIINQLNNLLGINQEKIYARKCIIKEVSNFSKQQFLDQNHLQGNDASSIRLGLYYNNELVSLMTFVKPRFNKKYEWELSRFCSKAGCNVIGGASKLWSYFIKNYTPKSVISYSNIAHTKGKLYETLGMSLQNISNPNYVWINNKIVKSRYQCQKHKLLAQGYKGNTEEEIMYNLKYHKLFDCGNKVWVWNKEEN